MALPPLLRAGLVPSEAEYLSASATHVSIVPLQRMDRVRLQQGVFGPFRPPAQAAVPLWLAVNLKGKRKARIVPPEWLSVEGLKTLLKAETSEQVFAAVPLHYVGVSTMLLESASDDIPDSDLVRSLLKDLRETRQAKVLQGLNSVNPFHLEMTNISLSEIAELRPFFIRAFNDLRFLLPPNAEANAGDLGDVTTEAQVGDSTRASTRGNESGYEGGESFAAGGMGSSFADESLQTLDSQELDVGAWAAPNAGRSRASAAAVGQPDPLASTQQRQEQQHLAANESMTDMDLF